MPKKTNEAPDVIDQGRAAKGVNTATGVEEEVRSGAQEKRLKGSPGGSELEIAGGEPKPNFAAVKSSAPVGAQAEPAEFVSNGSIDPGMVASSSGLVPVSATNPTAEEAEDILEANKETKLTEARLRFEQRREVDDATLDRMSAAEIRAVAHDRGYTDVGDTMGRKQSRSAFATAQAADKSVKKAKK